MTTRRFTERLRRLRNRLDVDPRVGSWDDACWVGRTFGLNPAVVVAEGTRLLALCDAADVATADDQDALLRQEIRLRPTRSAAEVQGAIAAHPHRLAPVAMAAQSDR